MLDGCRNQVAEDAKEGENRGRYSVRRHGVVAKEFTHVHAVYEAAECIGHLGDNQNKHCLHETAACLTRYVTDLRHLPSLKTVVEAKGKSLSAQREAKVTGFGVPIQPAQMAHHGKIVC